MAAIHIDQYTAALTEEGRERLVQRLRAERTAGDGQSAGREGRRARREAERRQARAAERGPGAEDRRNLCAAADYVEQIMLENPASRPTAGQDAALDRVFAAARVFEIAMYGLKALDMVGETLPIEDWPMMRRIAEGPGLLGTEATRVHQQRLAAGGANAARTLFTEVEAAAAAGRTQIR